MIEDLVILHLSLFLDGREWRLSYLTDGQVVGKIEKSLLVVESDKILNGSEIGLDSFDDYLRLDTLGLLSELLLS